MSSPITTCGNAELSAEDILRAITGTAPDGGPILRLVNVPADSGNYFNCNRQGEVLSLNSYIGQDEEGRPAIRVHISNLT